MSRYAEVAIDRSTHGLKAPLTYEVPAEWKDRVQVGSYLLVPLQSREATGYVVALTDVALLQRPKPIIALASVEPLFTEENLNLARWLASYYHAPLADCLGCLVAPGGTARLRRSLVWQGPRFLDAMLTEDLTSPREALARLFQQDGPELSTQRVRERFVELTGTDDELASTLRWARRRGWIGDHCELLPPLVKTRRVLAVELTGAAITTSLRRKGAVALACLASQTGAVPITELARRAGVSRATINTLVKSGLARFVEIDVRRSMLPEVSSATPPPLTPDQQRAVETIGPALQHDAHQTFLIHGVTASGKTEVYMRLIEQTLARGRNVIVLVPEIALTTQVLGLFRARFSDQVAILHSALSAGERFDEWQRLRRGQARIALGPRSAVFAPLSNVGLFILDEEHESSYKQENSPRYHAREVALFRARSECAVVVLGSATPSLESVFLASRKNYTLIEMPQRVLARPQPTMEIVDLRKEWARVPASAADEPAALGARLREALVEHVARDEQVMLFLNRRGYATVILCPECGVYERCPNCAVGLTYHQPIRRLRCHHCNFVRVPKEICPRCKRALIAYGGPGTQRLEHEVQELLPGVATLRMDRDSTTGRGSHDRVLSAFRSRRAAVLIGTQMIAKGLDFPGVTLVGVVNADVGLHVPDWRAAERTYQLLVQVAGRAGRGEQPGHVIVQTFLPHHYALIHATRGRFAGFVAEELKSRQEGGGYPPFKFAARLLFAAGRNAVAQRRCVRLGETLRAAATRLEADEFTVMGPAPCPISKLRGEFRWHLMVRDHNKPRLHELLTEALSALKPSELTGLAIDVDPVSVL